MSDIKKFQINQKLGSLLVPVESIKLNPKNVRKHSDRNIDVIANSLKTYGQQTPIVVHKGIIKKDNGTLAAAIKLGWTHIAAVDFDKNEKMAKAYELVDNRSSDLSAFDTPLLVDDLKLLKEDGEDLDKLGWNDEEMKYLSPDEKLNIGEPPAKSTNEFDHTCPECGHQFDD